MKTSRRHFVECATAFSTVAGLGLFSHGRAHAAFAGVSGAPEPESDSPLLTLKDAGATSGILVGCAVDATHLRTVPEYATLVRSQSNVIVGEKAFTFGGLRPTAEVFHFGDADTVAGFAETYGIHLRGQSLVSHKGLPTWFDQRVTQANAAGVLDEHIRVVAGRYAGRVHSWDVVSEAVEVGDARSDGLRDSPWLALLGPEYVGTAFKQARRADPRALLFYNESGLEGEDDAAAKKREAVLTLLLGLLRSGVPVDGLGIQSHLVAGHSYGPGVRQLVRTAHEMGLRVMLTELDVDDCEVAATPSYRDKVVAETYWNYLRSTLADGYVSGVLTWGITDRLSWLAREDARADGMQERPLPFDAELKPKLAFRAQRRALVQAPSVVPVLKRRPQLLDPGPTLLASGQ